MDARSSAMQWAAFAAQGLATKGIDATWDKAVDAYLTTRALMQIDELCGPHLKFVSAMRERVDNLIHTYGKGWKLLPAMRATRDEISAAQAAEEERLVCEIYTPFWQAQRTLAVTPPPTLGAALWKAATIEIDETWNDATIPRDCAEILTEDFARLMGDKA